jgi:4-hydroxyphenylacetate 3-monooxygenase
MHVEKEVDGGLIVSGAKVVATNSALTQYNFIGNYGPLQSKRKSSLGSSSCRSTPPA